MKKFYRVITAVFFLFASSEIFSQNVAINTSGTAAASTNMFEVTQASATNNTVGIFASHTGAATNAYAIWAEATGGTNKYALVVPSTGGSVGIGTVTPGLKLDVVGTGGGTVDFRVNGRIQTGDAGGSGGIWLSNASDGFVGNNGTNVGFWTSGPGWNAFQIIKASGNVGIGTAAPNEQLEITKNFRLPATTGSTVGVIYSGASRYIHNYGTSNFFAGVGAGNFTMSGTQNTAIGASSFVSNTTGGSNTGIGMEALYTNTTGNYNVANGYRAQYLNNNGWYGTAVGYQALYSNVSASFNSAFGYQALYAATGANNTALGAESQLATTSGSGNLSAGTQSLRANTIGQSNTAIGTSSMYSNIAGSYNTAIGSSALYTQSYNPGASFSSYNVAVGSDALYFNQPTVTVNPQTGTNEGTYNTAVGYRALYSNTTGTLNSAFGEEALRANTSGYFNTACGISAMYSNQSGSSNTGLGVTTLYYNTTGAENTAVGRSALAGNGGAFAITGGANTAVGVYAMYRHNTGVRNVAVGKSSLYQNIGGSYNSAVGQWSLQNTTADGNVGIGYMAGNANTSGTYNTCIGYTADLSAATLTNATSLGNGTIVNASNKVRLGNAAVTVVEGPVGYTPSDGRFKIKITEEVKGLDFINKLRPVVYNFDTKKFDEFLMRNMPDSIKAERLKYMDYTQSTQLRQSGFIAQEVENALRECGYDFNGLHKPENENDNYSISYGQFVVPLVKAVQELNEKNEAQQKTIELLLKRIEALENSRK